MIINKITKAYLTRNDMTNKNWLNNSDYLVVDDNSELAKKIKDNYPFIKLIVVSNVLVDVEIDVEAKEKEKQKQDKLTEIQQLKSKLTETDYKAIKYAEGLLSEEEYAETKAQRQAWRDRINELEV